MFSILIIFSSLISFSIQNSSSCGVKELIPKHYICYKLETNEKIKIDGKINDSAWQKVPFTDEFIDIQGKSFPKPKYITKAKMRCKAKFSNHCDSPYVGFFFKKKKQKGIMIIFILLDMLKNHTFGLIKPNIIQLFFKTMISKCLSIQMHRHTTIKSLKSMLSILLGV